MKTQKWIGVTAAGLAGIVAAIGLSRRRKKIGIAFGIPVEQIDFIKRRRAFLAVYSGLMDMVERVYLRSFEFSPSEEFERMLALPESDPERTQFEHTLLVERIAYYMSRSAVEDFHDIILLAANGRGIGALKILRGMYERTVTAQFVAENPSEAELFEDEFHIQQWNVLKRWLENAPVQVREKLSEEEIREFEKRATEAQNRRRMSICSKCRQPKPQAAWTPTNLFDMAGRIKGKLDILYTECYVIPTAYHHATPLGLQLQATTDDNSISFNAGPYREQADQAVMLAHNLLLNNLEFQNDYWNLGLGTEISTLVQEHVRVWNLNDLL